jgi:hypothetical protein
MKKFLALVLVLSLAVPLAFSAEDTVKLRTLGRWPLSPQKVVNTAIAKQITLNHLKEISGLEGTDLIYDISDQLEKTEIKKQIIPIGTVFHWMLFRDKSGKIHPLGNVEWAGQEPIDGFGFEIIHNRTIYRFFVPTICGNICLLGAEKQPEKPVVTTPQPSPQKPETPVETPKTTEPEQTKPITQPTVTEEPLPAPIKKHRPNLKIYAGPWIPWEPLTFSAENQSIDVHHNFMEYLPKHEKLLIDENSTTGTIYLNEKNFSYHAGDSVILEQQRSMTTHWSGINYIAGLEIKFRGNLWFDIAYYRSKTFHANVSEYTEDMLFKEVKYLGYYAPSQESLVSCPPRYHRYYLDLNRTANEHQTEYSITAQGIRLLLRYYLNVGDRFSLSPAFGVIDQQFVKKTNDTSISKTLFPFKGEIISESERWTRKTEEDNYEIALTGNIAAELKLLKYVSIAVEGSYQKFSEQQMIHESLITPSLNYSFKSKPWRVSATLKILF